MLLTQSGIAGSIQHPIIQVSQGDDASKTIDQPQTVVSFEGKSADEEISVPTIQPTNRAENEQFDEEVTVPAISSTNRTENGVLKEVQSCSEDDQSDKESLVSTIPFTTRAETYSFNDEVQFSSEDE